MATPIIEGIAPGSRFFAYLRDSGHENQQASCDQQERMVREVLAAAGATLAAAPFRDEARRGSSTVGRAALEALLAATEKPGRADGVIFWSSARMAREVNDAQVIRGTLRQRGYRLYFIADSVPQIGIWTPLLEVVQDIRNAQYLEQLSKEVKRGHAQLLQAGYAPTGKQPAIGYRIEREQFGTSRDGLPRLGVRWVKDAAVAERVALAWAMRAEGQSYRAVHDATRLMSIKTSFSRLFQNKLYMGTLVWGGVEYPNFVEPYVTPEVWDRVQAVGATRAAAHPRTLGIRYLLTGLLYCPTCGGRMVGKTQSVSYTRQAGAVKYRQYYYICAAKTERYSTCPQTLIRADRLDAEVVDVVLRAYANDAFLDDLYTQWTGAEQGAGLAAELAEAERAVGQHQAAIANLMQLAKLGQFASVGAELAAVEAALTAAQAKAALLRQRQTSNRLAPRDSLPELAARLRAALQGHNTESGRLLLARVAARVDVNPDGFPHVTLRPVWA